MNNIISKVRRQAVVVAVIGTALAAPLEAQGNVAACATATDSLNAGVFMGTAIFQLGQCGSSGASLLATLIGQSASAQSDSTGRFDALVGLANYIRSPVVVSAAIAVAQGTGNTQIARVTAFQVLLAEYNNAEGMDAYQVGAPPEACALSGGGPSTTRDYDAGISPQTVQQMISAASAVYHNSNDDPIVRSAAFCLRRATSTQTPIPIMTSLVTLMYVCGDKFKVHNGNPEDVQMTWNSYHVPPNARATPPILTQGALFVGSMTDAYFRTDSIASARLYYGTSLIQTRANGGTACP